MSNFPNAFCSCLAAAVKMNPTQDELLAVLKGMHFEKPFHAMTDTELKAAYQAASNKAVVDSEMFQGLPADRQKKLQHFMKNRRCTDCISSLFLEAMRQLDVSAEEKAA